MFSAIYIEESVRNSERVSDLLSRFPHTPHITIAKYGEVFNRNNQNFRLQKQKPALILANKHGRRVLETPPGYGFEDISRKRSGNGTAETKGFYFSHMLNCVYDCRYCFLQGMYRSANYVLFTNYEDFSQDIELTLQENPASIFYSGYDCDSLALEPISGFCDYFLGVFEKYPEAVMEIRTKSTQVRFLLERKPLQNCVIAMSFSPESIAKQLEHKVPSIEKRLEALVRLQQAGWPVALRFEPVIDSMHAVENYQVLFDQIFSKVNAAQVHSASLGEYRLPTDFYKNMVKLYPDEPLLARETIATDGMVALKPENPEILEQLEQLLLEHLDPGSYYRCA